jgi:hypothetical protein
MLPAVLCSAVCDLRPAGMMDWVPWANALGAKQTGTPPDKLIHVTPGLNRFKFFKEGPARYYSTSGQPDTSA